MVDTNKPSSTISAEHSQKKKESTVSWSLRSSCAREVLTVDRRLDYGVISSRLFRSWRAF
jgi:hypothetical protein